MKKLELKPIKPLNVKGIRLPKPLALRGRNEGPEEEAELEVAQHRVLSEADLAFKAAAKGEVDRYRDAFDTEFWFAVYFQTREQKEAVLERLGALRDGDKYVDGVAFAKALGITLPPSPPPVIPRINKRWVDLADK